MPIALHLASSGPTPRKPCRPPRIRAPALRTPGALFITRSPAHIAGSFPATPPGPHAGCDDGNPPETVGQRRQREDSADRSHRPHHLQTTRSPAQEAIVGARRQSLLLPRDDRLAVTRKFVHEGSRAPASTVVCKAASVRSWHLPLPLRGTPGGHPSALCRRL